MIFAPDNANLVIIGVKTQSRRLVSLFDQAEYDADGNIYRVIAWPSAAHKLAYPGRTRYQVGKTYAIQPGRGRAGIGKLTLLAIRHERVNEISDNDILAEGFPEDPPSYALGFAGVWDSIHGPGSFASGPAVWVLTFEAMK